MDEISLSEELVEELEQLRERNHVLQQENR